MGKRNPRVDAYIEKSPEFARPILRSLRATVHAACRDAEEEIKWGAPTFMYKGMMCGMAAFKEHAVFGFWKHALVVGDRAKTANPRDQFGCLTKVSDLPPARTLAAFIKKAARLNEQGVSLPRKPKGPSKPVTVPPALMAALRKNRKALAAFESFSTSHKREYAEWIGEAKSDDTRERRLAQAIPWIAEGKSRNWKYERKG